MKFEDATWGSSSSDDDDVEVYNGNSKAKLPRKGNTESLSKLPLPKRMRHQSSRLLLSSSSSSEDESSLLLSRHQSQKERKPPASYKKASNTSKKSPPNSRSRSIRKRPLPRPTLCGNLSDSSSSSDDSFIFRNMKSLTKTRENKNTNAVASGDGRKKRFSSPGDEASANRPRAKLPDSNVEKCIGEDNATDKIRLESEYNMSGNDSDSDDTAELIRQLTRKSSPRNKFSGSSVPSPPAPGCSTSPCHKTNPSPSNKITSSKTSFDHETMDADDEASFNNDDKLLTMETSRIAPNSNSKLSPQGLPRDDCASSNTEFSNTNNALSIDDPPTNKPIGFELPPQSSSSEESSVSSEEDEYSGDETQEGNRSITNVNNQFEKIHSFGGNVASRDVENEDLMEQREKQQEIFRRHENHRLEEEQFLTKTNQELFETAFDGNNNHDTRINEDDKPSRWEGSVRNHYSDQPQHHQPCIDLVDSDDSEQATTGKVYENEDSPRSPVLRKSPRFNIASRNFLYNKPWRDSDAVATQQEEVEDVAEFEDDNGRVPTRPRRVTQDHTNQILNHNNNSGGNIAANGRSSSYFQPQFSSNAARQQVPEQQDNRRSTGVNSIPRPWASSAARTARRMRDPAASNLSLAASVVSRKAPDLTAQNAVASNRGPAMPRRNDANIGDIRTFVSKRPALAFETRNRAKSIESVKSKRHDIQGHSNVTVVNHPPKATGSRKRKSRNDEQEDAIQVFEDEPPPAKRPARRRKTTKAKTKRKRTTTRRTKGRKRKAASGSRGRKFGKRSVSSNDDSGAWGSTGGGWASTRPVHKEDPAFRNVGAEIAF